MDKPVNKFLQPGRVRQAKGAITAPENSSLCFIVNVCSLSGKFENKIDAILSKRWGKVREDYKNWFATQQNFKLGSTNTTAVASDIWVINLLCQDKEGKLDPVALENSMKKLSALAKYEKASVHVSKLTTDAVPELNGMFEKHITSEGINLYCYE